MVTDSVKLTETLIDRIYNCLLDSLSQHVGQKVRLLMILVC